MEESDEASVCLRFVLPKGKTEMTCSEELAFAFENSQENGLAPIWTTHDDTLNISPVKTVTVKILTLIIFLINQL
jgi:hypothetical protein